MLICPTSFEHIQPLDPLGAGSLPTVKKEPQKEQLEGTARRNSSKEFQGAAGGTERPALKTFRQDEHVGLSSHLRSQQSRILRTELALRGDQVGLHGAPGPSEYCPLVTKAVTCTARTAPARASKKRVLESKSQQCLHSKADVDPKMAQEKATPTSLGRCQKLEERRYEFEILQTLPQNHKCSRAEF